MSALKKAPGPWQMREALTMAGGVYYTVTRVENRRRVHLEYATSGKPMLYDKQRAEETIAKATGGAA